MVNTPEKSLNLGLNLFIGGPGAKQTNEQTGMNYSNTCQIESIKTEVIDPDLNLFITRRRRRRRDRCVGREPSSGPNFEEMGVGSGSGPEVGGGGGGRGISGDTFKTNFDPKSR